MQHTLDRSEDHPYIRTDWVPGFERTCVIEGIAGQKGAMGFKINGFGFRAHSMKTAKKQVGTYRIFFWGGSTTEELYLPEEKNISFPCRKEIGRDLSQLQIRVYQRRNQWLLRGGCVGPFDL